MASDKRRKVLRNKDVKIEVKQGLLLFWKDFKFSDGTIKDKLVLILSNCLDGTYYIIALPTSNSDAYISGNRSFTDTVCFPRNTVSCFKKDTVIDLKNLLTLNAGSLLSALKKQVNVMRIQLPKEALNEIISAVRAAKTLTKKEKEEILGEEL